MIPKKQAVTGLTAASSNQTIPVHCQKCRRMIKVTRLIGGSNNVQHVCGKCKRK